MRKFYALFLFVLLGLVGFSQINGDYRTAQDGLWAGANWEKYDGSSWNPGSYVVGPTSIANGNTVTINHVCIIAGTTTGEANAYTVTNMGAIIVDASCPLFAIGYTSGFSDNYYGELIVNGSVTSAVNLGIANGYVDVAGSISSSGGISIGGAGTGTLILREESEVTADITNSGSVSNIIIKSNVNGTGSLISSGSPSATVERYVSGNSWHLVGSSVNGSTADVFNGCYLQYYTESSNTWTYITSPSYSLGKGSGYSIWSNSSATYSYTGALNGSDKAFSNLSYGGDSNHGFHILSNPFPAAIKWLTGSWNRVGVSATAKYYNGSNYVDMGAGTVIPAQSGFVVQMTSGTNSLTIPADSKVHSSTEFYKNVASEMSVLSLSLTDDMDETNDKFFVRFYEDASVDFEHDYDAYELYGSENAANVFAILNDEYVSTMGIPFSDEEYTMQLGLKKGAATNYTLTISDFVFQDGIEIVLEDVLTGEFITLNQETVYQFTSSDGDILNRFNLHFDGVTSVPESIAQQGIDMWANKGNLYIQNKDLVQGLQLSIFSIDGKLVYSKSLDANSFEKVQFDAPKGAYLVKLISGNKMHAIKMLK